MRQRSSFRRPLAIDGRTKVCPLPRNESAVASRSSESESNFSTLNFYVIVCEALALHSLEQRQFMRRQYASLYGCLMR